MRRAFASPMVRYAGALGAVGLATWVRWLLDPVFGGRSPYATYIVALVFVAWRAGLGPALLTLALGFLAACFFFIEPRGSLLGSGTEYWVGVGVYLFVGLVVATMTRSLTEAKDRAERRQGELADEVAGRQRLVEAMREETRALEALNRFGVAMASERGPDELVQLATDLAREQTGAAFGAFFFNVVDESGESYLLYTLSGAPREAFADLPMPRTTEIFGPTFRGEGAVRLDDVTADPRFGRNEPFRGMPPGHLPVRSYLAVPAVTQGREVLGGLFLGHPDPGVFTERAERIAAGLAAQAAVGIENARLQGALRRSEAHYRTLAEALPQLVWTCRPDGSCDYLNRRWYEFTGTAPEQNLGGGWLDRLHPDDHDRVARRWGDALEGRADYDVEYRLRRHDGQYRWFQTRGLPVRDDEGRVVRWFGTSTDIDDRKQAEEEIRRLNTDLGLRVVELQTLLDVAPVGIALAHDPECLDITANPALAELLGLPPDTNASLSAPEPERPGYAILRDGRELAPEELPLQRAAATGSIILGAEYDVRRADGSTVHLLVNTAPVFDEHGRVRGGFGIYVDLTDRRRFEADLTRAKEAAVAANEAKNGFLAMLSHELRTPLTPVLLSVSGLLQEGRVADDLRPTLEMIRRNVELEARLIDDLLDLMRIVRGKLTYAPEVVDAHALLRQTLEICRADVLAAGLGLDLELDAAERHVSADPARLQQVFWNLVKNAVKFTPRGGRLAIRSRDEPADDGSAQPRLVLEFADEGVGIEPELLPRIFDAFEQGRSDRGPRLGGLGLGLAISRAIVEAHGGSLSAHSEGKGRGSTFRIALDTVPAPASPATPIPSGADGIATRASARILLVEDDPSTLQVMARTLARLGHRVTTADGVASALRAADGGEFDLLISDIGLPDGDGLDLMRRLRDRRPLPGIALSGFGMDDDLRKSREAGFVEHLTKPINIQALDAAIRRVVAAGALMVAEDSRAS